MGAGVVISGRLTGSALPRRPSDEEVRKSRNIKCSVAYVIRRLFDRIQIDTIQLNALRSLSMDAIAL